MTQAGPPYNEDISRPFAPENCPLLVVKIGSSLLIDSAGDIREDWLRSLVADLAERHRAGQKIVIVSSGAIALGARRLKYDQGGRKTLSEAQASASVGQILLSGCWASLLEEYDLNAAQMLVTLDDLEDRRRYLNVAATLRRLLLSDAIPIINENDSVATQEIRFGDNDRLAARLAQAARADAVLLLSDVDGLYDGDPAAEDTKIIPVVNAVDDDIRAMVTGSSASDMGSGGMGSKLEAAQIASMANVDLAIISGLHPHPLRHFADGGPGTLFVAARDEDAHKSWLGGRLTVQGSIIVDAGAAKAIAEGNSLLPAGAISAEGDFARGDVVNIVADGQAVARGLAEYGHEEVQAICGKQTDEMEKILGTVMRRVLIHRDQMVML